MLTFSRFRCKPKKRICFAGFRQVGRVMFIVHVGFLGFSKQCLTFLITKVAGTVTEKAGKQMLKFFSSRRKRGIMSRSKN
jgi:hypothetical protein